MMQNRGYGFIRTLKSEQTIFITQGSLDAIGVKRLPEGMEIEFDVIKGKASDKVDNIIQIGQASRIQ